MSGRVARIALWLAAGQVAAGGLYWVFLNTPESNATMLAASALLIAAMAFVAAVAIGGGMLHANGRRVGRAVSGAPWIVVAALPWAALWWLVTDTDGWIAARSGEIAAWFVATFGWSDVSWLMRGLAWLSLWLRAVVGPLLALALFAALLYHGRAGLRDRAWIGRALRIPTLILATLAFGLLVLLPLQAAYWQPRGLPPTWIEPALAGIRLLGIGIAMTIAWAIMAALVSGEHDDEDLPAAPPPQTIRPEPESNVSGLGDLSLRE